MSSPNYAAEAAIKCGDPVFQHFLRDATKRPVSGKDEAAEALRLLAGVDSRKAFNASQDGSERWLRVRRLFQLWRNGVSKAAQGPSSMGRLAYQRGTPLSGNPFQEPPEWETEETEWELWNFGWERAQARDEKNRRG